MLSRSGGGAHRWGSRGRAPREPRSRSLPPASVAVRASPAEGRRPWRLPSGMSSGRRRETAALAVGEGGRAVGVSRRLGPEFRPGLAGGVSARPARVRRAGGRLPSPGPRSVGSASVAVRDVVGLETGVGSGFRSRVGGGSLASPVGGVVSALRVRVSPVGRSGSVRGRVVWGAAGGERCHGALGSAVASGVGRASPVVSPRCRVVGEGWGGGRVGREWPVSRVRVARVEVMIEAEVGDWCARSVATSIGGEGPSTRGAEAWGGRRRVIGRGRGGPADVVVGSSRSVRAVRRGGAGSRSGRRW